MSFSDILKRPLPSAAAGPVLESDDSDIDTKDIEKEVENEVKVEEVNEETSALTPEEDAAVDGAMDAVVPSLLLQGGVNDADIPGAIDMADMVESGEADILVSEGYLTEKTIVRFDKNAKRAQLYEVAVLTIAREKKDPLYRKLETVYKMERVLKAKLRKKYHSQANKKVKEWLERARKSKSGILAKIANKLSGK